MITVSKRQYQTWMRKIFTATCSRSSWAFHTLPKRPLALISSSCSGFWLRMGDGGRGPGSWRKHTDTTRKWRRVVLLILQLCRTQRSQRRISNVRWISDNQTNSTAVAPVTQFRSSFWLHLVSGCSNIRLKWELTFSLGVKVKSVTVDKADVQQQHTQCDHNNRRSVYDPETWNRLEQLRDYTSCPFLT